MNSIHEELLNHVNSVRIIDTHEHVSSPHIVQQTKRSILDFILGIYLRDDLLSIGLKRSFWNSDLDQKTKWRQLKQNLAKTRNTTYYQVLKIIFHDLYGLQGDILDQDWEAVSPLVEESAVKGATWYDYILKDKSNIDLCLLDKGQTTDFEIEIALTASPESVYVKESPEEANYELFRPVLRMDLFAHAFRPGATDAIEEKFGVRVTTFDEFEQFLRNIIPDLRKQGFVAIKSLLAYTFGLDHNDPDRTKAERAWKRGNEANETEQLCFRDFVVWLLSELAAEGNLTFEIHTGMSCCGARYPQKSTPHELINLIYSNPDTKYDLFHAGYPCIEQAAAMAKSLPNAYLNVNWLPIISRSTAQRYLSEVLDSIPMTKISWGGDAVLIEEVYAHSKIMKEILIAVLLEKLKNGRYDLALCKEIAERFLRVNALEVYGLSIDL
jgi:predicted TIM-barrel fold metal-dependent hydrolase